MIWDSYVVVLFLIWESFVIVSVFWFNRIICCSFCLLRSFHPIRNKKPLHRGGSRGGGLPPFGEAHHKNLIREQKEIHAWVPKHIEMRRYRKPCEASKAKNGNDSRPEATRKIEPRFWVLSRHITFWDPSCFTVFRHFWLLLCTAQAPQAQNRRCMRQLKYIENCMGKSPILKTHV